MNRKWNLQDIRPVDRSNEKPEEHDDDHNKQDIEPVRRRRRRERDASDDVSTYSSIDVVDGRQSKKKRVIIAGVIGVLVLAIGFLFSLLMGGAEVTVYPKFEDTTVQATFTAYTEPPAGELGYELMTLEAEGERQVSASGEEEVSKRATGNILVYNVHSESPQRLIKNTRFESPEGLIFRIEESIEVPGMTRDEEGNIVPGVITTEVFADGPGEQYNIDPTRFTIPGLEGTEQYDNMYAESNEAFTGGFEGSKFIIDDAELKKAKQSLHLELRDALLERVDEERPAGFILYDDAVTFAFDSLPSTEYGDELVTIKERARLQVPIFESSQFASYLAKQTVPGFEESPVTIEDPSALSFSYTSATTSTSDISTFNEIEFMLEGAIRIIWEYEEEKLKNDLAGLAKTALPNVLKGYRAIERAEAVVRPFWKQSFPDEPSEITIIDALDTEE